MELLALLGLVVLAVVLYAGYLILVWEVVQRVEAWWQRRQHHSNLLPDRKHGEDR